MGTGKGVCPWCAYKLYAERSWRSMNSRSVAVGAHGIEPGEGCLSYADAMEAACAKSPFDGIKIVVVAKPV